MKRAFVIINPVAGKGIIKQKLFALVEALSRKDYLATVYLTKSCGENQTQAPHAQRLPNRQHAQYDKQRHQSSLLDTVHAKIQLHKQFPKRRQ